jgi:hypothetical protein
MPAHKARDTYLLCISRITRERVSEVPRGFRTVRPLGWIIWKG